MLPDRRFDKSAFHALFQGMLDTCNSEDRQIRAILISAAAVAILGLVAIATVVAVMISANFNILNWME